MADRATKVYEIPEPPTFAQGIRTLSTRVVTVPASVRSAHAPSPVLDQVENQEAKDVRLPQFLAAAECDARLSFCRSELLKYSSISVNVSLLHRSHRVVILFGSNGD